jgi:ceramide glucosyltransferase
MLRDLLLPALWIDGWFGTGFVWRGHQMTVDTDPAVGDRPTA